jgi:glycosyltransferase involved in cell wall biosynthesis
VRHPRPTLQQGQDLRADPSPHAAATPRRPGSRWNGPGEPCLPLGRQNHGGERATSLRVIVLIPAYNERARVGTVVGQALQQVDEVVVIDDGSTDDTAALAEQAGAKVLRHEQNFGKGGAIATALDYFGRSDAAFAVLLDADGQHDPAEIRKFVEAAESENADVVVGTRMNDVKNMPRVRRWTNQFTSLVAGRLARQKIPDSQCGFRLLRRNVLTDLKFSTARFETETEMLIQAGRAGHKIANVPIRTIYEAGRASRIHPWGDTVRFFKLVGKYSWTNYSK